jgi:hypothetical protein
MAYLGYFTKDFGYSTNNKVVSKVFNQGSDWHAPTNIEGDDLNRQVDD